VNFVPGAAAGVIVESWIGAGAGFAAGAAGADATAVGAGPFCAFSSASTACNCRSSSLTRVSSCCSRASSARAGGAQTPAATSASAIGASRGRRAIVLLRSGSGGTVAGAGRRVLVPDQARAEFRQKTARI
jgi:hypothetical protein